MKLSETGKSKFWNAFYVDIELNSNQIECIDNRLRKIDFQEEDFQDSVVLSVEEAKNIYHDFASMYVIAKGTYPKDGMRKPFTLDILKMEIEQAEGKK